MLGRRDQWFSTIIQCSYATFVRYTGLYLLLPLTLPLKKGKDQILVRFGLCCDSVAGGLSHILMTVMYRQMLHVLHDVLAQVCPTMCIGHILFEPCVDQFSGTHFTLVFGWLNGSTFEGREQGQSYELQVGYAKGPITNRLFRYTLETTTTSTPPPGMQCT